MIHQYKLNDKNIILDVNSGSIHLVDDLAYDCIALFENNNRAIVKEILLKKYKNDITVTENEIDLVLNSIESLKQEGKIFSGDGEFKDILNKKVNKQSVVKALCLHVAHTCNLDCEYCFARGGNYRKEHALMPFEVGKQAIDFLIENSGNRRNLEVDFFGGEPLLNWNIVKQIVEYSRSIEEVHNKNFRFTLTTNGLLITDEVIDFCNKEMANVVLSLDGRPQTHNRFRKTVGGIGSYETVLPKFKKFAELRDGKNYYMRATFTKHNTDFTNDIFYMADLGFSELSMEPVVCKKGDKNELTDEDLPVIFSEYEKLAKEIKRRKSSKKNEFNFYHYNLDLKNGPCIHKRITGCGSGTEYMAVTPNGDLYPCHQFVENDEFLLGNIFSGIKNSALQNDFANSTLFSKPECTDCWAKFYCSGGCAANSYNSSGSINGIYEYGCKLFKKRIECAIMLAVE